nr:hypothetical protein CFP56_32719 [Quercus suber]
MNIENTKEALPEECLPNLISLRTLTLYKFPLPQGMRYLTALQHLNVWESEVVDLSNDWDEMEWQGLTTLLSLEFFDLPKLVFLPMGLQYEIYLGKKEEPDKEDPSEEILDEEEPNEEAKKPALKNWDLIKAFGCCNCSTTQQLTHCFPLRRQSQN